MKKLNLLMMVIGLASMTLFLSNCGDDETLESCAQDEFCTGVNVNSCCSLDGCVWKYDGKEYTADQEAELADELGCTSGSARVAAGQNEEIILKLRALMEEAKAGL